MRFLWRFIQWVVVPVLVTGLIAALYLQGRVDEEIRRRIEERFAAHYRHLQVKVHGARLVAGEGIEVRGLSLSRPGGAGDDRQMLYVDELLVRCRTDWDDLLAEDLGIEHVTVRRAIIRAVPDAEGRWDVAQLLPLPSFGGRPPAGEFEYATIEIHDTQRHGNRVFVVRDLNFSFRPQPDERAPGRYQHVLAGRFSADYTRAVTFRGQVSAGGTCAIQGKLAGLDFCPEFCQALPEALSKRLAQLASLRAQIDADFQLAYDGARQVPFDFAVSGAVARGRIDDARLPYPLTDLCASFHGDASGWSVHELTARNGQTSLSLNMRGEGYAATSPWSLQAESRQMTLDQQLFRALPEHYQGEWRKFLPDGKVDATLKLAFDGRRYDPEATVKLLGVSFYYHLFPYKLEGVTGTLEFKKQVLDAHLTAFSGSREVRIDGQLRNPGPQHTGWWDIQADDLPLDEKLFAALQAPARKIVKELHPDGTFDAYVRCRRDEPGGVTHKHITLALNRCSMQYERFMYPLRDIRGIVTINGSDWSFDRLEAYNDTARVTCRGSLRRIGPGDNELRLSFVGMRVPLEEELRNALRPALQRIWSDLHPQGALNLRAEVRYRTAAKNLDVWVCGETPTDADAVPISIEPTCFPYRLDRVQGRFVYENGRVQLHNLKAVHGATSVAAGGTCDLSPDGKWELRFSPLTVDRLRLDRDLVRALPARLAKGVDALKPEGLMALNGAITFAGDGSPLSPPATTWDLRLDLQQVTVDCGIRLENAFGGVTLVGASNRDSFHSRGELALDNVTWKGFQCTDVSGPLWFDDRGLMLGRWAERGNATRPARPIAARFCGGNLLLDAWTARQPAQRYRVYARLEDANLARITQEQFGGRQNLFGQVDAEVDLHGAGAGVHNLGGRGELHLREADIYELPQMVQLLSLLTIKPPQDTAFTTSDVTFRLDGGRFYFDKLAFTGDALSLYGRGEMDLERNVLANFYTMVGSRRVPVLSDVVGGASQQIMIVRASGPLDQLTITNEVLPSVNQALQQLQADLGGPLGGAATTLPAPGTGAGKPSPSASRWWKLWK